MQLTPRHVGETAREYALRMLKMNIISLDLMPGSSVSVYELSAELGISRTPVREALLELNKVQIIEVFPQKGSVISLIDKELVEEARFLRCVLESAIVELACDIVTPVDIAELNTNIKMQEVLLDHPIKNQLLQLDDDFHRKLFQICHKERLFIIKDMLSIHYDRVRNLSLVAIKDLKVVSDHKLIVEALKEKDKEKAKSALHKHLNRYTLDDEMEIRERYREYFKD